jgi:hypothetical protein
MSDNADNNAGTPQNVVSISEAKTRRPPPGAPPPPPPMAPPVVSEVELLVALAKSNAELFHDEAADPYALVQVQHHRELLRIDTKAFRLWFESVVFAATNNMPRASVKKEALGIIEGLARFRSPKKTIHLRVAEDDGAIFIDLTNANWEVVKVTPKGWEIITEPPVVFRRARSARPLPTPTHGGKIDELQPFVNVASADAFHLIVAWLVAAYRPTGPYTVLGLRGEQGSSKSTMARIAKRLTDPSKAELRALPRAERDLAVSGHHNWVLAFDNMSDLSDAMSDALCRVATGGGLATRQLYTDMEESVLDFIRPVVVNGIDDIATRPDLAERSIVVTLPKIPKEQRLPEDVFWHNFNKAAPSIFGALLDGVVAALANIDGVELTETPRMADFAKWVTAAEGAFGWVQGTILSAYLRNRRNADLDGLEADAVASLVLRLPQLKTTGVWSGQPTALY